MNKILPCFSFIVDRKQLRRALSNTNNGVFTGKNISFDTNPIISSDELSGGMA